MRSICVYNYKHQDNTDRENEMRFDTSKYEISNARQPRGRGQWGFFDEKGGLHFTPAMTFTEAKRWARANLKGNAVVVVAP